MMRAVLFSVLVLGAAAGRLGASTSAEARAKVWLRQHQSPDAQGLDDLKNSDPNSYAIVQALLMKQQAGLLDASNPGGFHHEEHQSAADIMRSAPSIEGASSSMSELAVSAPVTHASFSHGNPWAFKAKASDDDALSIITGGSAPSSADDAPQPISEVAVSAPVQRRSFSPPARDSEEQEERAALNKDNSVLSILGGNLPDEPRSASRRVSEVAIAAPVRRAEYTPPVQQAEYSRGNPLAFNAKKADDDIMAMVGGDPSPPVSQPISEVAISAPVQHAEYTPPVQQVEYTPPAYTPPAQVMSYTPPVQQAAYSPSNSLLSSNSQLSQTVPEVARYTPPVQAYTPPVQAYTPPVQQEAYTPPVQTMQYTPPVQQAESSLLSSKRSTVTDAVSSGAPENSGLSEFAASDPNGYAIVANLLKQQQSGMLDPSNPGSFKHEEHESAVDIMKSAPQIEGASVPMSELAYSAPVEHATFVPHGNPWGFNAKKADDDALSIIGVSAPEASALPEPAVHKVALSASNEQLLSILSDSPSPVHHASYTQYTPHTQYHGRQNPLAFNSKKSDDDLMSIIGGDSSSSQPVAEVSQPAASMIKQSSYLSQINFPGAPMKQREEQPAEAQADGSLKSFNWGEYGDVASGKVQVRPAQTQMMQQEETVSDSQLSQMDQKYEETKVKGGSLSSWLAPMHEAPAAPKAPVAENQEQESYGERDPNNAMAMDNYIDWAHSRAFQ
eukprot:gnl/MRDRNA2_/MRDRNA2_87646_c0_seq1.p1 gnl/MRDRNA2_/MRDRNA2_87646_c0~~gnl/MRDRNA2_/MRDRNA2_87646_c0_seq1.p1  ORF type:complete len:727 (+),score=204.54 gnl/MRDRNA2_/MRDRNA2_87646_c0_seq1:58-2238(+)